MQARRRSSSVGDIPGKADSASGNGRADLCRLVRGRKIAVEQRLARGFRPFSLRTSDGHEYAVPHPEFVLIGRQSLAVLDADQEIAWLDPLHIVAIKDLPRKKDSARKR